MAPTFDRSDSFKREYRNLEPHEQAKVKEKLADFIDDLQAIEDGTKTSFRSALRVKPMKAKPGIWEMTWDGDGRATFEYGDEVLPGKRHVIWRRIGGHDIFG